MEISILCSNKEHPVVSWLQAWSNLMLRQGHAALLFFDKTDLPGGDVLFLVSCSQIISDIERSKYKSTLVLHASDLPKGRGWSPHVWEILDGKNKITVSLLEASDPVDTGAIWLKTFFMLDGDELLPEINKKLFEAEVSLMTKAVEEFKNVIPTPQSGNPGVYMKKRTPDDSRLDPHKTIAEQFELLRVVDSERYPAFFEFRGSRYIVKIEKQ